MKDWHNSLKPCVQFIRSALLTSIFSSVLLGCDSQPKSMFEQQAEARAGSDIELNDTNASSSIADESAPSDNDNNVDDTAVSIDISRRQAVASQASCDDNYETCQRLEINVLEFTPKQPWLASIMWQNIARVVSPELPLTSQEQVAKDTIAALLKQIEFSNRGISSQPQYHRIDTELTLNQTADNLKSNNISSAYLLIKSSQHSNGEQQQLNYVMLDVLKKLQLNIEDILLPEITTAEVLIAFQQPKKEWLARQSIEPQYLEDWPLELSQQWYLDEQGLHMVYQAGALLTTELKAIELIIPSSQLQQLIKPNYIVAVSTKFP